MKAQCIIYLCSINIQRLGLWWETSRTSVHVGLVSVPVVFSGK